MEMDGDEDAPRSLHDPLSTSGGSMRISALSPILYFNCVMNRDGREMATNSVAFDHHELVFIQFFIPKETSARNERQVLFLKDPAATCTNGRIVRIEAPPRLKAHR